MRLSYVCGRRERCASSLPLPERGFMGLGEGWWVAGSDDWRYMGQMAKGLEHLHDMGLAHATCLENLMVDDAKSDVIDFGMAVAATFTDFWGGELVCAGRLSRRAVGPRELAGRCEILYGARAVRLRAFV